MPKKLVIAVDFDDVLVETGVHLLSYYNHTFGSKVSPRDLYSQDPDDWLAPDMATVVARVNQYLSSDAYNSIPPKEDTQEYVRLVSSNHEMHVITARPPLLEAVTNRVIQRYFNGCFKSVEYTSHFHKDAVSKSSICLKLSADILVDDFTPHLTLALQDGVDAVLFGDYPWNQPEDSGQSFTRAKNWREMHELISSL